jgi:hypothetical protein
MQNLTTPSLPVVVPQYSDQYPKYYPPPTMPKPSFSGDENLKVLQSTNLREVINTPKRQPDVLDQQKVLTLADGSENSNDGKLMDPKRSTENWISELGANNPNDSVIGNAKHVAIIPPLDVSGGEFVQPRRPDPVNNSVTSIIPKLVTPVGKTHLAAAVQMPDKIEGSSAVIGVADHFVSRSLELPITVANPIIADAIYQQKLKKNPIVLTDKVKITLKQIKQGQEKDLKNNTRKQLFRLNQLVSWNSESYINCKVLYRDNFVLAEREGGIFNKTALRPFD